MYSFKCDILLRPRLRSSHRMLELGKVWSIFRLNSPRLKTQRKLGGMESRSPEFQAIAPSISSNFLEVE